MKDGGYLRYIIPMIWFSLFLIGCKSQKQETAILFDKNPPFMIAEAQFQRWTTANNIHKSGWNLFVTFEEIEPRSEERRVGKECRARGWQEYEKQNKAT